MIRSWFYLKDRILYFHVTLLILLLVKINKNEWRIFAFNNTQKQVSWSDLFCQIYKGGAINAEVTLYVSDKGQTF